MKQKTYRLPVVGQRIVRSVCAVLLCFGVYLLRGRKGIPFYSALAVLQCMQPYQENTKRVARNRLTGTLIGAFWGFLLLLVQLEWLVRPPCGEFLLYGLTALLTGVTLYTTVLLRVQNTAYFSCVVFLSITVNHITDVNPYLFVLDRVLDTLIGVVLALAVNNIHLPRRKQLDTLFVSGVDDTMMQNGQPLTAYSRVELNRLVEQGAKFTLSTNRTPATIREILPDIRLELPIIAMDGAVLYDMKQNCFPRRYTIPKEAAEQLLAFLRERDVHGFINVIRDDVLMIYYDQLTNEAQRSIYDRYKKSPYRNYVRTENPETDGVVYVLLHEKTERMQTLYEELYQQPWWNSFRGIVRPSENYSGYSYLKLYSRQATREHMLQELLTMLHIEKAVTFGSIPGKYDVFIQDADKNAMVRKLKQLFEPVVWSRQK